MSATLQRCRLTAERNEARDVIWIILYARAQHFKSIKISSFGASDSGDIVAVAIGNSFGGTSGVVPGFLHTVERGQILFALRQRLRVRDDA